ncbi:tetraspanin-11 isoform X12 [Callithrix jacchus]
MCSVHMCELAGKSEREAAQLAWAGQHLNLSLSCCVCKRSPAAMAHFKTEQDDWLIVYLKYLLFVFNFFFWYFCLLLVIFLVELVAAVLAHVYYQRLSDELKQHLNRTLTKNYGQLGATQITASVDRLQQDFKCCGSNSSADWQRSTYILSQEAEGRRVPDSCCKTVVVLCGRRAHPSNIYKVEGGCLTKLEQFLADHLLLMGAVGIGVACLQICGMVLTCCLHQRLQRHFY